MPYQPAKPVPVQREYVFNESHPFAAYFAHAAPSGEIDGEAFSAMLKDANLVDGKALSDTGVDVIFARAKARHPGSGRQVPYRIFLGALSLTAGHLGMTFTAVVNQLLNGGVGGGGGGGGVISGGGGGGTGEGVGAGAGVPTVVPPLAPVGSPTPPPTTPSSEKKKKSGVMNFFIKPN